MMHTQFDLTTSNSSHAAGQPPPLFQSCQDSNIMDLSGRGNSQHVETGDITVWRDVRITMQMSWGNTCSFIGTGVSVLRYDRQGAIQCIQDMVDEVGCERWAKEKLQEDRQHERFSGPAFTMNQGHIGNVPSNIAEKIATVERAAEYNKRCREFGVRTDAEVPVPFILKGVINLKTGHVSMWKTHYRYVFNTIEYDGVMSVFCQNESGERHQTHSIELLNQMDAATRNQYVAEKLTDIRLKVESPYAKAWIKVKPTLFGAEEPRPTSVPSSHSSFISAPRPSPCSTPSPSPCSSPTPQVELNTTDRSSPASMGKCEPQKLTQSSESPASLLVERPDSLSPSPKRTVWRSIKRVFSCSAPARGRSKVAPAPMTS